jgi:hypothetical protein
MRVYGLGVSLQDGGFKFVHLKLSTHVEHACQNPKLNPRPYTHDALVHTGFTSLVSPKT